MSYEDAYPPNALPTSFTTAEAPEYAHSAMPSEKEEGTGCCAALVRILDVRLRPLAAAGSSPSPP